MLLSIIVPSFNHGRYIERTLGSIFAQDYRPLEVIVVDGASTDETLGILQKYASQHRELRWISEPDNGPADAVNKGLALAKGEITAIQSSDDIYYPNAFSAVMREFERDPTLGFVIGDYNGIDAADAILYTERVPEFSWEAYFGIALCIPQSSIFFRTSIAREVGGWNAAYFGCDLDFWLKLLLRTRARRIDQVLSGWRIYAGARTHRGQQKEIWNGYWRMIADNELLQRSPARIRRLANASRHIFALRFPPTTNLWVIRWHLLQALAQHPSFWRHWRMRDLARIVPGYGLGRRFFSFLRRLSMRDSNR